MHAKQTRRLPLCLIHCQCRKKKKEFSLSIASLPNHHVDDFVRFPAGGLHVAVPPCKPRGMYIVLPSFASSTTAFRLNFQSKLLSERREIIKKGYRAVISGGCQLLVKPTPSRSRCIVYHAEHVVQSRFNVFCQDISFGRRLGHLLLHSALTPNSTVSVLVVRVPFFRMEVGVAVMSPVPNTILERIGCYLERRIWKVVLALIVVQLNRAETDVVA